MKQLLIINLLLTTAFTLTEEPRIFEHAPEEPRMLSVEYTAIAGDNKTEISVYSNAITAESMIQYFQTEHPLACLKSLAHNSTTQPFMELYILVHLLLQAYQIDNQEVVSFIITKLPDVLSKIESHR